MTDPFDGLRQPITPADPDPRFAADLRALIERRLALPRGVAVTAVTTEPPTTGQGAAIPYLAVAVGEGRRALDWYTTVLDARLIGEPVIMPDGKLGHSELALAGGTIYLAEEFPELGVIAPVPAGSPVSLSLPVPDVAETVRKAMGAGGTLARPIYDAYGNRNASVVDPFGHRWLLRTPLAGLPQTDRQGDVGYAWLTVPDPDRAADFYAAVLGWRYSAGYSPGGRQVDGQSLPMGIGAGEPGWHLSYAVDDVAAAVERVRAAGGTASDPADRAYGAASDCTDDQGTVFALHMAGGSPRTPPNGERPGDLSYLTLYTPDSARFRAFYGAVLGLEFDRGRVEDGWAVRHVVPMTGIAGGQPAAVVPMWKVADVAAAVQRVRAAGGTATDPERQPYGTTAECTDDQGVRFYLGDS